jgi:hypothetical protein
MPNPSLFTRAGKPSSYKTKVSPAAVKFPKALELLK